MNSEKINPFVGYEYKTVVTTPDKVSMYLDCYENFGWIEDTSVTARYGTGQTVLKLKRDRKIINKMELTRLQRNFEACINDIEALERTKTAVPTMWSLVVGVMGTAFMAGSVFAVTHQPPIVYRYFEQKQAKKVQPLIDEKYDEIYSLCEKGHSLL